MDPITVFLSMAPLYKIITITIWAVVGFTIHLILKTLKNPKQETTLVKTQIDTNSETDETSLIRPQEGKNVPEPSVVEETSKLSTKTIDLHSDEHLIKKDLDVQKTITDPMTPHMKPITEGSETLRLYQREGITGYTRKSLTGIEGELEIQRKAERLTKEEAWSELSKSFWETRIEGLKQFHPEIYEEIRYWETHLDEYNIRIGLMWVLDIPFGEYDLWVNRS